MPFSDGNSLTRVKWSILARASVMPWALVFRAVLLPSPASRPLPSSPHLSCPLLSFPVLSRPFPSSPVLRPHTLTPSYLVPSHTLTLTLFLALSPVTLDRPPPALSPPFLHLFCASSSGCFQTAPARPAPENVTCRVYPIELFRIFVPIRTEWPFSREASPSCRRNTGIPECRTTATLRRPPRKFRPS